MILSSVLYLTPCMISQDAAHFHPLKNHPITSLSHIFFYSCPHFYLFTPFLLIQLPPLMHSKSEILCLTHTNTNCVSRGHMLTRGGPEYSHLPAFPMSHRARVWENVHQTQYTHTHTGRNHTSAHMPLTPSQPLITPRQPAHLMLTVTR